MAEKEVKDIDSLIDQGLNDEKNELDLREKELDDEDLIKEFRTSNPCSLDKNPTTSFIF